MTPRVAQLSLLAVAIATAAPPAPTPPEKFVEWARGPASVLMLPDEQAAAARVSSPDEAEAFITSFWARRDPDPDTAINEFEREFRRRIAYADKEFADAPGAAPGWSTARGTVYLLLGEPLATGLSAQRVRVGRGVGRLLIWRYPHPRQAHREMLVLFARDGGDYLLVRSPGSAPTPHEALMMAREQLVREASVLDAASGRAAAGDLHLVGSAIAIDGGVLALLDLDPQRLLGSPEDDAIAYGLRIEAVPAGDPGAGGRSLGEVRFAITPEIRSESVGLPLRLAVWYPAADPGGYLRLVEIPTGRHGGVRISAANRPPAAQKVARYLGSAPLAGGEGVATVFYGAAAGTDGDAIASLTAVGEAPKDVADLVLPGGTMVLRRSGVRR